MGRIAIALCLTALAGCDTQGGQWYKQGATQDDFNRDSYECERDTRMASGTFGRGILIPAVNASEFAGRCMQAHGWIWAVASGGWAPSAAPAPTPTPQRDASGRQYGDSERVYCSFPNSSNPHLAKVELAAMPCSRGGGIILGPAT
jgi:hypothetical protein